MSFLITQPEMPAAVATDLEGIGSTTAAANAAQASPTTRVVPAADDVSALTAAQFATHAKTRRAVSAHAAAIHEMRVTTQGTSTGSSVADAAAVG